MEVMQHGYPQLTHTDWQFVLRGNTNNDWLPPEEDFDLFDGELKNGRESTDFIPVVTPPPPSPSPSPPPLIKEEDEEEEQEGEITFRDAVDVLAGRGGGSNNNPGNKKYWKKVMVLRPKYRAARLRDYTTKSVVANQLLMLVRKSGGRFLERNTVTRVLSVLPEARALEMCKQHLRDRYVPIELRE